MIDVSKYLSGRYVEGGRTWPDVDCYGIVLEVRKDIGLPDWPSWDGVTKHNGAMHDAGMEQKHEVQRCDPEHGAVAACFQGSMLAHVAVIVEINGMLHAIESNPKHNITCLPLRRFERRFLRVEYYR